MTLRLHISAFQPLLIPLDFEIGLSREFAAIWIFISSKIRGLDPRRELVKWDMRYLSNQMYCNASKRFIDASVKCLIHAFELDDLYLENLKGKRLDQVCFACLCALDEFSDNYIAAQFPQAEIHIQKIVDIVKTKYRSDRHICETIQSMFNGCLAMFPLLKSQEDRRNYLPDMLSSWKSTIEGIHMEKKFVGKNAKIPTQKEYWQHRVLGTVGVLPLIDLCYCINGDYTIQRKVRLKVRPLEELVCYQLAIQNDLVSLYKDLKNNHNVNWVKVCDNDVSKAETDYHQATQKIEEWTACSFEKVVVALKNVGLGCARWQARAMRYSRLMQLFCYET